MTKRFLACLLALVMLLGVTSASAEVVFPLDEEVTLSRRLSLAWKAA